MANISLLYCGIVAPPPLLTADSWWHAQWLQTIHNAWRETHTYHRLCADQIKSNLFQWTSQMVWILTKYFAWLLCDRWMISLNYQGLSSSIVNARLCACLYFIVVFYMLAYLQWQAALSRWSSAVRWWCSGTAGRYGSWCCTGRSQSSLSIPPASAPDRLALSAPETDKKKQKTAIRQSVVRDQRGLVWTGTHNIHKDHSSFNPHIQYVQTHSRMGTHIETELPVTQLSHKPAENSSSLG